MLNIIKLPKKVLKVHYRSTKIKMNSYITYKKSRPDKTKVKSVTKHIQKRSELLHLAIKKKTQTEQTCDSKTTTLLKKSYIIINIAL